MRRPEKAGVLIEIWLRRFRAYQNLGLGGFRSHTPCVFAATAHGHETGQIWGFSVPDMLAGKMMKVRTRGYAQMLNACEACSIAAPAHVDAAALPFPA